MILRRFAVLEEGLVRAFPTTSIPIAWATGGAAATVMTALTVGGRGEAVE